MRRTRAAVSALVLGLLGAGCSGAEERGAAEPEPQPPPRSTSAAPTRSATAPLSRPEQDWTFGLAEWVSIALTGIDGAGCTAALRDVGDAPTERLERLESRARRACRGFVADPESPTGQRLVAEIGERIYAFETASGLSRDLPVRGGATEESRIEPLLSRLVTKLSGSAAEVRCWSPDEWGVLTDALFPYGGDTQGRSELAGWAYEGKIHLVGSLCRPLVDLHAGRQPSGDAAQFELASALRTITHESEHHTGELIEATAECHAMQRISRWARAFGASRTYAESLARLAWSDYELLPDTYRSDECRDGGELDLEPKREGFP